MPNVLLLNGKSYIRRQLSISTHPKCLWFLNFAVFTAPYTLHRQSYSLTNSTKMGLILNTNTSELKEI